MEVRGFLGMTGTVRIWIKGYAKTARPLINLTCKSVPFTWTDEEQRAMDDLKVAVTTCPAIRPIDYNSGRPVILMVNSSYIAVGYILYQDDEDGRC